MKTIDLRSSAIAGLGLVLACCSAPCQTSTAQEPLASFKTAVNLVLIDASVRDRNNRLISGLKREDFEVFEDGKPQPVRYASENELPLAVALVVDTSGSMRFTFSRLRDAAINALGALKPQDRVAVFAFTRRTQQLTGLTTDHHEIERALDQLHARGGTNILEALYAASTFLKHAAPQDRRAIILISDNIASKRAKHGEHEVEETALEFETDIHSIEVRSRGFGILAMLATPGFRLNVKQIAEATGGKVLKTDAEDVGNALTLTLERLRKRYTLGYYPAKDAEHQPGSYHKLEVRLTKQHGAPRSDYYIAARRGYFTPKE